MHSQRVSFWSCPRRPDIDAGISPRALSLLLGRCETQLLDPRIAHYEIADLDHSPDAISPIS